MSAEFDFEIIAKGACSNLAREKGLRTWSILTAFVSGLPYGRNACRDDFSLVLKEGRGSCSSKHALLKTIADENGKGNQVALVLGMYRMNRMTTPKIGGIVDAVGLDCIPEAHCYVRYKGKRHDFTSFTSDFSLIEDHILYEEDIIPEQVVEYKVEKHQDYLKKWLKQTNSSMSFDALWKLREKCIAALGS